MNTADQMQFIKLLSEQGSADEQFLFALSIMMHTICILPEERRAAAIEYSKIVGEKLEEANFNLTEAAVGIVTSSTEIAQQVKEKQDAAASKTDLPKKDRFH